MVEEVITIQTTEFLKPISQADFQSFNTRPDPFPYPNVACMYCHKGPQGLHIKWNSTNYSEYTVTNIVFYCEHCRTYSQLAPIKYDFRTNESFVFMKEYNTWAKIYGRQFSLKKLKSDWFLNLLNFLSNPWTIAAALIICYLILKLSN